MYDDKLDGKIDDAFWARKVNEWREQERRLESGLSRFKVEVTADSAWTAKYILELANQAHVLYLAGNHTEPAHLLKTCPFETAIDGVTLWSIYRKPYDL